MNSEYYHGGITVVTSKIQINKWPKYNRNDFLPLSV